LDAKHLPTKGNLLTKPLQHLVSKQKQRYCAEGFDLDLSYITDQVIAMGVPATGKAGLYRNPLNEVVRFLNYRHPDSYKIYNLCTRPKDHYDPEKFEGRVACFPFEDHGVPQLENVEALARSVCEWLAPSRARVVCIHCLAGKGRTGLMVVAAMLRIGLVSSAREGMALYGEKRMKNKKGVTQASQRRWCEYYGQMLQRTIDLDAGRTFTRVSLHDVPSGVSSAKLRLRLLDGLGRPIADSGPLESGSFNARAPFSRDICVVLEDDAGGEIASMWLHAAFIDSASMMCTHRYWDVNRHHKQSKKVMKKLVVELCFEDDGSLGVSGGGTLAPITDKEFRKAQASVGGAGGDEAGGDASGCSSSLDASSSVSVATEDEDADEEDESEEKEDELEERASSRGTMDISDGGSVPSGERLDELNEIFSARRGQKLGMLGALAREVKGMGLGDGEELAVVHEGELIKRSGGKSGVSLGGLLNKADQRRFALMSDNTLRWYKGDASEPSGALHVGQCTLRRERDGLSFALQSTDRKLALQATKKREAEAWAVALIAAGASESQTI
jgi:protein-tyrosine phosphatase